MAVRGPWKLGSPDRAAAMSEKERETDGEAIGDRRMGWWRGCRGHRAAEAVRAESRPWNRGDGPCSCFLKRKTNNEAGTWFAGFTVLDFF